MTQIEFYVGTGEQAVKLTSLMQLHRFPSMSAMWQRLFEADTLADYKECMGKIIVFIQQFNASDNDKEIDSCNLGTKFVISFIKGAVRMLRSDGEYVIVQEDGLRWLDPRNKKHAQELRLPQELGGCNADEVPTKTFIFENIRRRLHRKGMCG